MYLVPGGGFTLKDVAPQSIIEIDSHLAALLAGKQFCYNVVFSLTGSQTQYIEFITGNKAVIVDRELFNIGTSNVSYTTYEAPTITDGTLDTTAFNTNRVAGSVFASAAAFYTTPSGVSGGTQLISTILPATAFYKGAATAKNELVLKPSTKYVSVLVNLTAVATQVCASYKWQEIDI
jgi:hypothetical protein